MGREEEATVFLLSGALCDGYHWIPSFNLHDHPGVCPCCRDDEMDAQTGSGQSEFQPGLQLQHPSPLAAEHRCHLIFPAQ